MRRRRSWPQRILLSLLIVGALLASSAAALGSYLTHKLDQITYVDVALSPPPPPGEPRNLLIVGSDSRDSLAETEEPAIDTSAFVGDNSVGSGQRSDTIIVMRIDPRETSVDVLSVPRDLWVPIADTGGSQRINTAYAGGPQRLVDTIEEQFDLPIHHYIEIDFVGFAEVVSAVGGVPVWFDTPVRDARSGLSIPTAGCHRLDAESALAFARSRAFQYQDENGRWHTDPTGDLGRITRQQVFLRRAADQVGQLGITDALTLNRLLDVGVNNVTLSSGFGLSQLRDLAQRFSDFDSDAMRTYALPTYSFRTSGGALVEGLLAPEAQPMLNVFRGLPPDTLAPVQVDNITVLNGTGIEGQAALVADALEQIGFTVADTGNVETGNVETGNVETSTVDASDIATSVGSDDATSPGRVRTIIRHAPDAEAAADLLERHLTTGAELVVDRTLDDGAVVLEVGHDFTTIGRNARPPVDSPATTTTTSTTTDPSAFDQGNAGQGNVDQGNVAQDDVDQEEPASIGVAPDPSKRCI